MEKEYWGALVNAIALIVTQLVSFYLDAPEAELIAKIVAYAQPVVIPILVKMYADRKAAEVRAEIAQVKSEIAQAMRGSRQG